ncbi:hypothetical protein [Aureispira anguillae]|uniref:Uncharacterized protein n=1 Tax=Aureispira anguillae TaxID=2864201 RepID=A0A915YG15_9BACT|nr:hypothetical protein [Aureispira anguillae]BDS12485.1 hypothetical protein AsAng_0032080 [Aureispira anguillae]
MVLKPDDFHLVEAYLNAIREKEVILWEGKMQPIKQETKSKETRLLITFLIGVFCIGIFPLMGLLLVAIPPLTYLYSDHLEKTRQDALTYTRYLITPKRLIFITWHKKKVHINSIFANNINKVLTNRSQNGEVSICFVPRTPASFDTYYYTDGQKSPMVGFINIGDLERKKVLQIIQKQVLLEQ